MNTIEITARSKSLPEIRGCRAAQVRVNREIVKIITLSASGVVTGSTLTPWVDIFVAACDGHDDLSRVYLAIAREGIRSGLIDPPSLTYEWDGDQIAGSIQSVLQVDGTTIAYGPEHRLGTLSGPEVVAASPLKKLWSLFR